MKAIYRLILLVFLPFSYLGAFAQVNTTNKGTDFWLAYMENIRGVVVVNNLPCELDVYLTSDVSTTGTVSFKDGSPSQNFTITANQVTTLVMPQSSFLNSEGQFLKGIHITSVLPIVVYAHIHANAVSGATLVLPVNTLGKDYYSINYTQMSNEQPAYSAFVVVAAEDSTTVEITPTAALQSGKPANVPFTIHLQQGELYQGLSTTDLTGTRIRSVSSASGSCKKIAVFSGSSKIGIGCKDSQFPGNFTADNLFQQVYPTASWGKNYYTAPLANRFYDTYRIILSDPASNVVLNGSPVNPVLFTNNFYYEFNSTVPNIITADKPIQVVQYAVTQGKTQIPNCPYDVNQDLGDPEMIFLTPIEQTVKQVTLYSTPKEHILKQYINVIIKTTAAASFILDGVASPSNFIPFAGDPAYAYGQFAVNQGTHNISAAGGFNAIAYGYGQYESYGYAAGTNLQDLNKYVQFTNPANNQVVSSGCTNQSFEADVTLPYQTTQLSWNLNNNTPVYVDKNPKLKTINKVNGQTLYIYKYPNPVIYTNAGQFSIKVTAFNPIADVCGSNDEIDLSFTAVDPPAAKFGSRDTVCLSDTITFHDQTNGLGTALLNWHYDFGNGDTSSLQSPVYIYKQPGDYKVTQTVTGQTGCISNSFQKSIHVLKPPIAKFGISTPDCASQAVTFSDSSQFVEQPIKQWVWDFGDGSALQINTSNVPFQHTYAKTGSYAAKLFNVSDKGCSGNTYIDTVVVHPQPLLKIVLPDVCEFDTQAKFIDQSTIADSSTTGFTYLWDFGDPAATPSNPNLSTVKNPVHNYLNQGHYHISHTVTSKNGCQVKVDTVFTVNGTNPKADFSIVDSNSLCSDHEVFLINNSSVDFGIVTKIVVYFDVNDTTTMRTYIHPAAGQLLRYSYPVFYTGPPKSYTIRMIAYSGGVKCVSTAKDVVISLLPAPKLTFAALGPVCQNAPPVNLVVTENTGGPAGQPGVFSGAGVSGTTFYPSLAGAGSHNLQYIFTPNNGCADTITQSIFVNNLPVVKLGPDTSILAGKRIKLIASATGDSLMYKWVPSVGLSADNILNPTASPPGDTTYTLTVTGRGGCSVSSSVKVYVLQPLVIPNTFTPNADGVNDTWDIKNLKEYSGSTVNIYNRNGQIVYSSIGYSKPWDGKYNNIPVPEGTYYYIINPKHGREIVSGYITIIR